MTFEIGDKIRFKPSKTFGGKRILPKGITKKKTYVIDNIHCGIDGAYDWDDLFLEGFGLRKFCEFDFEKVD